MTQVQPRTPGRFLGGNALSGFSSILASQNGPQRSVPRQAGKPAPETLEEDDPSRREPIRCTLPLTIPPTGDIVSPSKWRGRRRAEISSCPERDVFGASILQLPSAVPLPSCPGHDRDGTLPLQRTQATRLMCKHWHTSVSCSHPSQRPTAPHSAENAAGLRPTCFSVCVCRCCPAPGCYALLLVSRVEPWDHQFDLYASPLNQFQG